jgi:hypothetical protein
MTLKDANVATYRLLVLSNPIDSTDKDFEDWYVNQHLGDVIAVEGFVAAPLFKLSRPNRGEFGTRYAAIYELETDDLEAVDDEIESRRNTPALPLSEAMNTGSVTAAYFEAISERVCSPHSGE